MPAVAPDFHPTNTRRMRRALAAVIRGAVSKDTVSWEAWNARSLANDPIEENHACRGHRYRKARTEPRVGH